VSAADVGAGGGGLTWVGPGSCRVGDTEFVTSFESASTPDRFCIKKRRELIEAFVELLGEFTGANIVELGISQGGSTALLALVARPGRAVALELEDEPVAALVSLLERHGLGDSVRPYFGVDQADRARVAAIVDGEFGDEPLDLVFDDASHMLDETRASFEVLFPRLRPGGLYVIEDWDWQHKLADGIAAVFDDPTSPLYDEWTTRLEEVLSQPETTRKVVGTRFAEKARESGAASHERPLTAFLLELLLARASSGDAIAAISVRDFWVVIQRGPAALDPATFAVADLYHDHFGIVPPAYASAPHAEEA
jgi:predicted O-methyltransferase YrrM